MFNLVSMGMNSQPPIPLYPAYLRLLLSPWILQLAYYYISSGHHAEATPPTHTHTLRGNSTPPMLSMVVPTRTTRLTPLSAMHPRPSASMAASLSANFLLCPITQKVSQKHPFLLFWMHIHTYTDISWVTPPPRQTNKHNKTHINHDGIAEMVPFPVQGVYYWTLEPGIFHKSSHSTRLQVPKKTKSIEVVRLSKFLRSTGAQLVKISKFLRSTCAQLLKISKFLRSTSVQLVKWPSLQLQLSFNQPRSTQLNFNWMANAQLTLNWLKLSWMLTFPMLNSWASTFSDFLVERWLSVGWALVELKLWIFVWGPL